MVQYAIGYAISLELNKSFFVPANPLMQVLFTWGRLPTSSHFSSLRSAALTPVPRAGRRCRDNPAFSCSGKSMPLQSDRVGFWYEG